MTNEADAKSYAEHVAAASKHCRCCPHCDDHPCAGALAGGICDQLPCHCDDDDIDELYAHEGYDDEVDW